MFRAAALSKSAGYHLAFAGYGEDWDLFLRLSLQGSLANLTDILLRYRMHPHSYNRTRRAAQVEAYLVAVNRARAQNNLAPLTTLPGSRPANLAEVHRLWAEWAIEGREHRTARRHSRQALLHAPFQRASWQFLKYTAGLAARQPTQAETAASASAKN